MVKACVATEHSVNDADVAFCECVALLLLRRRNVHNTVSTYSEAHAPLSEQEQRASRKNDIACL